jgi:hypothetical protein
VKKKAAVVASDGRMNKGRDKSLGFSERLNAISMKARDKLKTQAIMSMLVIRLVGILLLDTSGTESSLGNNSGFLSD